MYRNGPQKNKKENKKNVQTFLRSQKYSKLKFAYFVIITVIIYLIDQ